MDKFKISETSDKMKIVHKRRSFAGLFIALIMSIPLVGLTFISTTEPTTVLKSSIFSLFFILFSILFYWGLSVAVNNKIIIVTKEAISIKLSLMPFFSNTKIDFNNIKQINKEIYTFHSKRYADREIYNCFALNKENQKIVFFNPDTNEENEFLFEKVNTWVKNNDVKLLDK